MDNCGKNRFPSQDISFHLASSDKDLMEKVSSIMKRNGHLSFSDSMGHEHYIVDGRCGIPGLSRNIDHVARKLSDRNRTKYGRIFEHRFAAIDKALEISGIPSHLKGYRYIKFILGRLLEDDTLISPISKTIYPELSRMYNCKGFQIDRDIRYAIGRSAYSDRKPSPKSFLCILLDIAEKITIALSSDIPGESGE